LSRTAAEIQQKLEEKFPGKVTRAELEALDPFLVVETSAVAEIGAWLRDEPEMAFDIMHCLSGVDYPEQD